MLCITIRNQSFASVRIIGLFPSPNENTSSDLSMYWGLQAKNMFLTAMSLAEKYRLFAHGQPIQYDVHRAYMNSNGFWNFDALCQYVTQSNSTDVVGIVEAGVFGNVHLMPLLASQLGIPVVSYAATNLELSDITTYPTFYRMAPCDALLAKAIVDLFTTFSWKTCTLIFEKGEYGYAGFNILMESYQKNINILNHIVYNPTLNTFNRNLKQSLQKTSSKIILVWANPNSTLRILQHALDLNLLDGSFIWILTAEIDLSHFPSDFASKLVGILSVIPMVRNNTDNRMNMTLLSDVRQIWRNLTKTNRNNTKQFDSISPFAMYAFDATWLLVNALAKISFDTPLPSLYSSERCIKRVMQNHTVYMHHLENSAFSGISGSVEFRKNESNDRISGVTYGLYNVQWTPSSNRVKATTVNFVEVMYWSQSTEGWANIFKKKDRKIVWPGNITDRNPSENLDLRGQTLRILMIEAPPFVFYRNASVEPSLHTKLPLTDRALSCIRSELETTSPNIFVHGFLPDLIFELKKRMEFDFVIELPQKQFDYHGLAALMQSEDTDYDIIMADLRITANRMQKIDYSISIHDADIRIIMRDNSYSFTWNIFSCFNPFTWEVWVVILALVIHSGILIYWFEYKNFKSEVGRPTVTSMVTGVLKTISSVIMMSGDVVLTSMASRLTVLGLYALGVILVAIYTANLSSFLTLNRSQSEIRGIDDIKDGKIPFSRIGIVMNSSVSDYYSENISKKFVSLQSPQEIYERLLNHQIDAAIWDAPILEYAVSETYCGQLALVGEGFLRSSYGLAVRKDWPYKPELDAVITRMRETETFECLENRWFQKRKCPGAKDSVENENGEYMSTFTLEIMSGIFILFLIHTAIAIVIHLWNCRRCFSKTEQKFDLEKKPVESIVPAVIDVISVNANVQ